MLLNFPPPQRKAASVQPAASPKKQAYHTENAAFMQGLELLAMYDKAVFQNLIVRACHKYLAEASI